MSSFFLLQFLATIHWLSIRVPLVWLFPRASSEVATTQSRKMTKHDVTKVARKMYYTRRASPNFVNRARVTNTRGERATGRDHRRKRNWVKLFPTERGTFVGFGLSPVINRDTTIQLRILPRLGNMRGFLQRTTTFCKFR